MKTCRHKRILELIEKQAISTQEELADLLRLEGYEVTQATISRDIKELRLVKIPTGENTYRYGLPREKGFIKNDERLRRMVRESVLSIDYSENLVILRTFPGNAQAVASLIDSADWPEIIGSVAGDDTILLVTAESENKPLRKEVSRVMQNLKSLME